MKILVTGGAGFIGSNFIKYLFQEKSCRKIVNLDKLTYAGNLENLRDVEYHPDYIFIKGDIADKPLVDKLFSEHEFQAVINFAAESHVDRSIMDSSPFIKTNITGTQVLLETARKYGVEKFIQVSTDEVYGSLELQEPPFTEKSPLRPNSPYSASKAGADLLCRAYFKTYGLPVIITRCSNNYGPYQFPEKFVPLCITNIIENKPIPIYGNGLNVRDWIHVKDHCRALFFVLENGKPGEVYNIGAEQEKTNLAVVKAILEAMGKNHKLINYVQDRPGHDQRYALDAAKIRNFLGWSPEIKFDEGLVSLIRWYTKYRPWWERVKNGDYQNYARQWYGGLGKF